MSPVPTLLCQEMCLVIFSTAFAVVKSEALSLTCLFTHDSARSLLWGPALLFAGPKQAQTLYSENLKITNHSSLGTALMIFAMKFCQ